MMTTDTLAQISAIGPYFKVFSGPRPDAADFSPLIDLHREQGALEASVTAMGKRLGTDQQRPGAFRMSRTRRCHSPPPYWHGSPSRARAPSRSTPSNTVATTAASTTGSRAPGTATSASSTAGAVLHAAPSASTPPPHSILAPNGWGSRRQDGVVGRNPFLTASRLS